MARLTKRGGRTKTTWGSPWKTKGDTVQIRIPKAKKEEYYQLLRAVDWLDESGDVWSNAGIDKIRTILTDALTLRANAGGAIKAKIREALQLLDEDVEP